MEHWLRNAECWLDTTVAELVVIPNAGHVLHEEQLDAFMRAPTSFLK